MWGWYEVDAPSAPKAPAVHQDTLKSPLRHMVTGEVTDSAHRLRELDRQSGVTCVGTEKLSDQPHRARETITDDVVTDRIARAEAVCDDPSRRRAAFNQMMDTYERNKRLFEGR